METYHKSFSFIIFVTIIFTFNSYCLALKCMQCANSDKDCTINPENIKGTCDVPDQFCFMKLDDKGQVDRGCGAKDYCDKLTKEECDVCEGETCNNKIFPEKRPKCHVCSGKDCLKVDSKNAQFCQFYKKDQKEHCFTNTEDNNNVIRDCIEGYTGKCEGNKCTKCSNGDSNDPCNKEEVVPVAFSCYTCKGDANKDCTINPQSIQATECKETDKFCFMKLNDKGQVDRGCGAKDYCDKLTKEECDVCEGATCNNKIFPEKRPKCHVCSGKDCLKVDSKNAQFCQFYKKDQKEHCFTNTEDNNNVIRDCIEGYTGKCEGNNCKRCSNGDSNDPCNKDEVVPAAFSCYTCRSDADAECENAEKDKAEVVACKDSSKGCYSERWDGKTFRACAEILDQNETEACKKAKDNICKICDKDKCNGAKFNSGTIKSISVILMISSILLSGKFFN